MKGIVYFGILFAFLACVYGEDKPHYDLNDAPKLYVQYKIDYNKSYPDVYQLIVHYEAFKDSLKDINILNGINQLATYDLNQFSDYTEAEIKEIVNGAVIQ